MKFLLLTVLCVMLVTCDAYYARRYRNYRRGYRGYGGYRRYGRYEDRYGHGSGYGHGIHGGHESNTRVSPGIGVNHVDTEVTHINHGDHVHTITRAVPHVYAGNSHVTHGHFGSGLGGVGHGHGHGLGHGHGAFGTTEIIHGGWKR